MWRIVDSGTATAEENMAIDCQLLKTLGQEKGGVLHFYEWSAPSATYGHFIQPAQFLHLAEVAKRGISLAKRPTGGGIVFHVSDFAFSLLIPSHHSAFSINPLENYAFVNRIVSDVIGQFSGGSVLPSLLVFNLTPVIS